MSKTYKRSKPRTQKAIGILTGIDEIGGEFDCQYLFRNPRHQLIQTKQDIADLPYCYLPGFARGCPLKPRHGFVNSRTVTTKAELTNLLKAVKQADPEGEIVLGPHIKGIKCSSVYASSGLLSIGAGNDGATNGKHSFGIHVAPLKYDRKYLKDVRISSSEAVYLEAVFDKRDGCYITQVRGGPRLNTQSNDYIPYKVKVERVVVPCKDLLKWEQDVKSFVPGVVVYGNGSTLASHHAIHCVLNHIPFITSHKPMIGEVLKETETKHYKLTRDGFQRGVCYALNMSKRDEFDYYFRYCLSVLHNWAYLRSHPQADQMLGVAVTLMVKLCASLSFGEYRHGSGIFRYDDRDAIYATVLSNGTKYLNRLPKLCEDFCCNDWTDGFGGLPWASCSYYSAIIWNTIIKMYNRRNKTLAEGEIGHLVGLINRTVNMAHNNDWWFDKIASKHEMDLAAKHPGLSAFLVSNVFYRAAKGVSKIRRVRKALTPTKKAETPFELNTKGKLVCAYIRPKDNEYNNRCPDCGYYDCWCDSSKMYKGISVVKVWEEGEKSNYEKTIKLSRKEIRKHELANGKVYLTVIPKVGIKLPTGRVIKFGGKV